MHQQSSLLLCPSLPDRFIKTEFSGTTAVICIIRGSHLYTFNVGDSRAILASEVNDECVVTELTHDHKPSLPEEKARIESAGGRVFSMEYEDGYDGPVRVWLADQDIPGLAMSRSLCDTVAHSVGVISTPEVCERTLTDDDRVIVMGSDGLWEFIPSEEVIHLIEDCEQPEVGEGGMMERRKRWSGCLRSRGSDGLTRRRWWTTRRLLSCFWDVPRNSKLCIIYVISACLLDKCGWRGMEDAM